MLERRLLFVAGATPQIITETVYKLAESDEKAVRTEVVAITTTLGKERILRGLLGRGGHGRSSSERTGKRRSSSSTTTGSS